MRFEAAYCQMAGDGKARNQDALFNGAEVRQALLNKARAMALPPGDGLRLAVADGVFNSPGPHRASRRWMQAFAERGRADAGFLRNEFPAFSQALKAEGLYGAACTFAAVDVRGDGHYTACNVGDSRICQIGIHGHWQQISHDHTVWAQMAADGDVPPDADHATLYDMLAECLIADTEEGGFAVHTAQGRLAPGECLLLCSDGLSDAVPADALVQLWQAHADLPARLEALRRAVRRVPFHDDCSIVALRRLG